MKKPFILAITAILFIFVIFMLSKPKATTPVEEVLNQNQAFLEITPISHASGVLTWGSQVIYMDPVGGSDAYADTPAPDIILVTDIHGDHFEPDTLMAIVKETTQLVAPQAVADQLDQALLEKTTILANGETTTIDGIMIEAIPMYNLPESEEAYHVKGRGNGYILESEDNRVYIAGDTADIPEMRNLEQIDIAFIPMNLPYTMDAETAAEGVLAFAPTFVYPYHYRQPDGFADVAKFKELVEAGNPTIQVIQLDWYAQ